MGEVKLQLKLSEARIKLTQLEKLLKPGESLEVRKEENHMPGLSCWGMSIVMSRF
jgi:hypothetical protein